MAPSDRKPEAPPAPAAPASEVEQEVRAAARRVGLNLAPHHLPGVAEQFARLTAQGELLLAFPLEPDDEPAPVYLP